MKVRDLRQMLAKFEDNLPVVFCSGDSDELKIHKLSDIVVSDAFIQRDDDGVFYCKFGKTPISEKHVFINIDSTN
jgi:hypothetical protein